MKVKEGALLKVEFKEAHFAFARVLQHSQMAFYNYQVSSAEVVNLNAVYEAPIAFIVPVYDYVKKSGRWPAIDIRPLEPSLLEQRLYFMKDSNTGEYSLYESDTGKISPSSPEACRGLERAAVWEAEHIENRLQDFFNGNPNKWVEQLI